MQSVKVTFKMASPVFIDSEYPIHLDALLAFSCVAEMEESGETDCWAKVDDHLAGILDKTNGDEWVWKASKLFMPASSPLMQSNQIRKSDPDMYFADLCSEFNPDGVLVTAFSKSGQPKSFNPETFAINTVSGQRRGYQWLTVSRWVDEITAYAFGDIDAIQYYLRHIRHIGKSGRNGYGRILSTHVEPHDIEDDWRLRTLPLDEPGKAGVSYAPVRSCLRAPYWRKTAGVIAKEVNYPG